MRAILILCGLLQAEGQQTQQESELTTAIATTAAKVFTFTVRPVANIPDGFPQERAALAGTPLVGEYSDGVYHARDGTYEIYRKDSQTAVRTERGWLPFHQFISPLKQDMAQAFDDGDGKLWRRGNV